MYIQYRHCWYFRYCRYCRYLDLLGVIVEALAHGPLGVQVLELGADLAVLLNLALNLKQKYLLKVKIFVASFTFLCVCVWDCGVERWRDEGWSITLSGSLVVTLEQWWRWWWQRRVYLLQYTWTFLVHLFLKSVKIDNRYIKTRKTMSMENPCPDKTLEFCTACLYSHAGYIWLVTRPATGWWHCSSSDLTDAALSLMINGSLCTQHSALYI